MQKLLGFYKSGRPIYAIQGGAPTVTEQLDGLKSRLTELAQKGMLEESEQTEFDEKYEQATQLKAQLERGRKNDSLFGSIGNLGDEDRGEGSDAEGGHAAKSLGEHFVKAVGDRLPKVKGISGATLSAPEWSGTKANTDTQVVGSDNVYTPYLTEFDRTIIQEPRPAVVVTDLIGKGTLGGTAIQYLVEQGFEGDFGMVAEGGAKPQLHVEDPDFRTDVVKKIAGFFKFSDEMLEDLPFIVSEINNRGLYELAVAIENQILNGDGTGQNLEGILNRDGIQTIAATDATPTAGMSDPDLLFHATTMISLATGLDADGIVINSQDYERIRLGKDDNGQYYGGGYFQGAYGNGGVLLNPPLWGRRTVVTPRQPAGTALVGAFRQGATLYSKGGIRVESTNSHATDFTSNLVTTRIETRRALAVRYPAAFAQVQLSNYVAPAG
jgi:HK97 family phage major capsid protein